MTKPSQIRAAEILAVHNGLVGDEAKGFLDGFHGRPPRTDVAHKDAYETGWIKGLYFQPSPPVQQP